MKSISVSENSTKFLWQNNNPGEETTGEEIPYRNLNLDEDTIKKLLKKIEKPEHRQIISDFLSKISNKEPEQALEYFKRFVLILKKKGIVKIRKESITRKAAPEDKFTDDINGLISSLNNSEKSDNLNLFLAGNADDYLKFGGFDNEAVRSIQKISKTICTNVFKGIDREEEKKE